MVKSVTKRLLVVWALCLMIISPSAANAYDGDYGSLDELNDEVLFLGDVVKISTQWCWASKKPTGTVAKKRLEVFVAGRWKAVGKNEYVKSGQCSKKYPFQQRFVWEVDVLGDVGADNISGKLRMRDSTSKPSIYVQSTIFESEVAYQAKQQAEADAAKRAEEERRAKASLMFMCLIQGGQWNSQGDYCVYPPKN